MSLVDSILPTTCQSISLSCNGVITPTKEVENLSDDPMLPATTAIVFPAFNHVRITPVEIRTPPQHHDCSDDDDLSDPDWDVDNDYGGGEDRANRVPSFSTSECRKIIDAATDKRIPEDDVIKGCLILENTMPDSYKPTDQFLDAVLGVTDGKVNFDAPR